MLLSESAVMRLHSFEGCDLIVPHLGKQDWNEAEVLGSAVWLWMHSASHRNFPLQSLSSVLLPAIKHRQFLLAYEVGRAVFYLSWANLSAVAEQRYISQHPVFMPDSDWQSGERLWILDWVAPFGHTRTMSRLVRQQLFAARCARYLMHRGNERGLKIKTRYGGAVFPHEAHDWFVHHPVSHAPGLSPPESGSQAAEGLIRPAIFTEHPSGEGA